MEKIKDISTEMRNPQMWWERYHGYEDDASLFFVLISLWPISLLFGTIGGAIFFLFYKPIVFLLFKSGDWCDGIVNWLKSKKEQRPNSKDEGV